jgi:hypothetical protein
MAGHTGSKRCPVVASSRQVVGTLMDVTRGICLTQCCFFSEVRICVRVAWEVIKRCSRFEGIFFHHLHGLCQVGRVAFL